MTPHLVTKAQIRETVRNFQPSDAVDLCPSNGLHYHVEPDASGGWQVRIVAWSGHEGSVLAHAPMPFQAVEAALRTYPNLHDLRSGFAAEALYQAFSTLVCPGCGQTAATPRSTRGFSLQEKYWTQRSLVEEHNGTSIFSSLYDTMDDGDTGESEIYCPHCSTAFPVPPSASIDYGND